MKFDAFTGGIEPGGLRTKSDFAFWSATSLRVSKHRSQKATWYRLLLTMALPITLK
jgi:hypothetical protein